MFSRRYQCWPEDFPCAVGAGRLFSARAGMSLVWSFSAPRIPDGCAACDSSADKNLSHEARWLRAGAVVSSPGPCASSGGRLSKALFLVFRLDSKGAKVCKTHKCKSCRSRQELSNEYLLLVFICKFGVDTAENGPLKVCQKFKISQKPEKNRKDRREDDHCHRFRPIVGADSG